MRSKTRRDLEKEAIANKSRDFYDFFKIFFAGDPMEGESPGWTIRTSEVPRTHMSPSVDSPPDGIRRTS